MHRGCLILLQNVCSLRLNYLYLCSSLWAPYRIQNAYRWLRLLSFVLGTQPLQDGKIHDLEMCYYLNQFDTCGIQIQIRAKRCLHRVVYELLPTSSANSSQQITDASYCAGKSNESPVVKSKQW